MSLVARPIPLLLRFGIHLESGSTRGLALGHFSPQQPCFDRSVKRLTKCVHDSWSACFASCVRDCSSTLCSFYGEKEFLRITVTSVTGPTNFTGAGKRPGRRAGAWTRTKSISSASFEQNSKFNKPHATYQVHRVDQLAHQETNNEHCQE